jgi:hypothetical protein
MKNSLSEFTALGRSLSSLLVAATALWLSSSPTANSAGLIEPFTYSNGPLTTVSGGAWQFWEPGAGDASVVNNAMRFDGTTDVIRTFPAVLTAPGQTATITFTINVNIADTSEGYAMDFLPSSAPFNANTNYGNQFSLGFDYEAFANQGDGRASIDVAEGGSASPFERLSSMTEGATHSIRVDLARGAANTSYSLFVDGGFLHAGTFLLSDARGMNAVELEQSGASTPDPSGFATVDNLTITPEPAGFALLAFGGIALLSARRRQVSF